MATMTRCMIATALLLVTVFVRAADVLVYEQQQGGRSTQLKLSYSHQDEWVLIASQSESETFFTRTHHDGDTWQWQVWGEAVAVEAQRRQGRVRVRGVRDGSGFEYSFALDDSPWYQALSYALGR